MMDAFELPVEWRGTVESLKRYDAAWDIGGIDIYPISYPPGRHTAAGGFRKMHRAHSSSRRARSWLTMSPVPR